METKNDSDGRVKVRELIKDIHIAQLVTQGADGRLHARPMAAIKDELEPDALWFMTRAESDKIEEIGTHSQVLLAYSEPQSQTYVSVSGKATVVQDQAKIKELWSEFARTWFPKGYGDPNIRLIRVEPEEAEYWDSASGTLVYAYGYLKARLTGEPLMEELEKGHVDFKTACM